MNELAPFRFREWSSLILVFLLALGLRAGYLLECANGGEGKPAWQVQGDGPALADDPARPLSQQSELIGNLRDRNWFGARAPLADEPEDTAALSPGYPWFAATLGRGANGDMVLRWANVLLGALTAGLYLLFARRAFRSLAVGLLAGLLTAIHPYWIVNSAEIADGALASFLLAFCLFLGTRVADVGGPFGSLLFGIALAALALVRAAMLPFTLVALLWFLPRCRFVRQGWLCALLAFLGFANGLAPWTVRNWQTFDEPLPIVSTTWLHLWMGNNPRATGSHLDEAELRHSLGRERVDSLLRKSNQVRRYDSLAWDTWEQVREYPGDALNRRLMAGAVFLLGEPWLQQYALARKTDPALDPDVVPAPTWLHEMIPGALAGSLIVMILLGLWGWRRSLYWKRGIALATLAAISIPLPYVLGHAGVLVGPRLPLDGVYLTFAALALAGILGLAPLDEAELAGHRIFK